MKQQNAQQLAQSASALGAGILGFGLGAKWGNVLGNAAIWFIVLGSIFHVWGMYLIQMKGQSERRTTTAKLLGLRHGFVYSPSLQFLCIISFSIRKTDRHPWFDG